jgi:hypothetical protein
LGFLDSFGKLTPLFILVIVLGLFAAGVLLKLGRDEKSKTRQALAMFLFIFFAALSGVSNINYLYTEAVWQPLRSSAFNEEYDKYKKTLRALDSELKSTQESDEAYFKRIATAYSDVLNNDISGLKKSITNSSLFISGREKRGNLEAELREMRNQALDPGNPGCGTKCKEHMRIIDQLVPTTELIIPKSKKYDDLEEFLYQYSDAKMYAYCSGEVFSKFHTLKGLVENTPNSDFCTSVAGYLEKHGSNKLEKLRREVKPESSFTEVSLKRYIDKMSNIGDQLGVISNDIVSLSGEFTGLEYSKKNGSYPRAVEDVAAMADEINPNFSSQDIGKMKLRSDLLQQLKDKDILIAAVNFGTGEEFKEFTFDELLSHNDVVTRRDEPLQPFFEVLKTKQNELIGKFEEAFDTERILTRNSIDISNGQVGEIRQTLEHAFLKMPFVNDTVFATVCGLIIDLIPVIFAFVAFHGYVPEEDEYDPVV